MKGKINVLFGLVFLFSMQSCIKDRLASGDIETELREVETFDRLLLEGSMDVVITQDPDYSIKVVAGENKIRHIKTKVSGNTLRIYESNNNVQSTTQDRVYVSQSYFESISLDGSGDITGSGITADDIDLSIDGSGDIDIDLDVTDKIYFEIDGSGDILVEGSAERFDLDLSGSGSLDARHIPVSEAYIMITGSGEARVQALDLLDVHIHGSGDVYYLGNPAVMQVDIQGSGGIGPL